MKLERKLTREQRRLYLKYADLLSEMVEDYLLNKTDGNYRYYNNRWKMVARNVNESLKGVRLNVKAFELRVDAIGKGEGFFVKMLKRIFGKGK